MNKHIYGRFCQKHDIEANWLLATNFAPLEGEIVVYDADATHKYPRIKIGIWDGESEKTNDMLVSNLPFVNMDPKDIDELLKNIECETLAVREADGDNIFSIAEGTRITGGSTNKDMITEMVGSLDSLTVNLQEAQAHQDMSMAFGANSDTYGAGTVSFGVNTSAGTMAYYWDAITFGDKPTIQLSITRRSSTQSNPSYPSTVDWAKGDRVTIKTKNTNWVLAGTIESVSGNVITLDAALPFTDIGYTSTMTVFTYAMPHDRTIHNIDKPESGVISIGFGAIAMGAGYENKTRAPGMLSLALGYETLAAGSFALAGGHSSQAGYASIAFGNTAKALGEYSVAHGHYTNASGPASTALGYQTEASGQGSIALGYKTGATALGSFASGARAYSKATAAHAFGVDCEARAYASTAEGSGTIAASSCQHVEGIGNEIDAEGKYAHIIGKGALGFTNDALDESKTVRANIHTVDWDGNAWYKGDVKAGTVGLKATATTASDAKTQAQKALNRSALYYASSSENVNDRFESGAFGLSAKETARYGAALGWGSRVTGAHGMAFGACTWAQDGQTAVGKANDPEKTYANGKTAIFMVGNGTTDAQANATKKSNAFAVTADGIGYLGDKKILVEGNVTYQTFWASTYDIRLANNSLYVIRTGYDDTMYTYVTETSIFIGEKQCHHEFNNNCGYYTSLGDPTLLYITIAPGDTTPDDNGLLRTYFIEIIKII